MGFQQIKNNDGNSNIPEEVLELLPWYATGKLSVEDKTFFEIALSKHTSLEKELKRELALIKAVSNDHSLLDLSVISAPEERLKSVFNMIDTDEAQAPVKNDSLLEKFKSAFDTILPKHIAGSSYARFASVGALALSVAILAISVAPSVNETSEYTLASADIQAADEQAQNTTSLIVGFNGTPEQLENNKALKEKLMKIETAPESAGFYQIRFKNVLTSEEIKQTLEALQEQQDLVWFVGEAD